MKLKGTPIDRMAISAMARWLWLFMIMSLTMELLEIMMLAYERAEEWEVIGHLLTHQLSFSFISLQMVGGGLIPLILLGIVVLMGSYMDDRIRNTLTMVSSLLLLLQVLAMRWNVVIGGQMFSKSMSGFREAYAQFSEGGWNAFLTSWVAADRTRTAAPWGTRRRTPDDWRPASSAPAARRVATSIG